MELSIDTSTRYASVALSSKGKIVVETSWGSKQNHSVEVMPALLSLMERQGIAASEIEAVFVTKGPGGFSALRVGISIAKTFSEARKIPLVAVNTLDVEAWPYLGLGLPVLAMIEAGRRKLYIGRYGIDPAPDCLSSVETHEEVIASVKTPVIFCGEGVRTMGDLLRESLGELAMIVDEHPPTRKASVLSMLGYKRILLGDTDDPVSLQPSYMRGSQFEAAQQQITKMGRRVKSNG